MSRTPPPSPWSAARGGALALAALLLAASAVGDARAASEPATRRDPAAFHRPRVLVFDLVRDGARPETTRAVEAAVTRWAAKNPHLEVISTQELASLMELESERQTMGLPDEGRLAEISEKLDANLVIFGSVRRRGGDDIVELQLFEAAKARALHRDKVRLREGADLEEALGRASTALVGRVLSPPALGLSGAAARLVDQLPAAVFTDESAEVTTVPAFTEGDTRFTSTFGEALASEVAGAIRRRAEKGKLALKRGLALTGRYRENADMVELSAVVTRGERVVHRAQTRVVRGALDEESLRRGSQAAKERRKAERRAGAEEGPDLVVDAFTEKGRIDVLFVRGERFHLYVKMNRPGYVRILYHLADGRTRALIEDAYPIREDQVGRVVRYPTTFGPAPPYGVEKIVVIGFEKKPTPLQSMPRTVAGTTYDAVDNRGFVVAPRRRAEIRITTTPR